MLPKRHIKISGIKVGNFRQTSSKTEYRLEHYLDLLERKPRSVFQAKPVKAKITKELLDWGRLLPGGNTEMVKLLRLCVDNGEERILSMKELLPQNLIPYLFVIQMLILWFVI